MHSFRISSILLSDAQNNSVRLGTEIIVLYDLAYFIV